MVGPSERCVCHLINGLRDGSDLGLIPDVVRQGGCQGLKIVCRIFCTVDRWREGRCYFEVWLS